MAGTYGIEVEKRIKALRKKLTQIEKLKAKGGGYTPEEAAKIASEPKILADIAALERGEEPAPNIEIEAKPEQVPEDVQGNSSSEAIANAEAEEPPDAPAEPAPELSPLEAEKKVRALKKKIGQIQKLKERGGSYTKEETEKIESEVSMSAEVTDLEIGLLDPEAKKTAVSLKSKLDQIRKLKSKSGAVNLQEKEKIRKEDGIKKELSDLLAARIPYKDPTPAKKEEAPPSKKSKENAAKAQPAAPVMPAEPVEPAHVEEEPRAFEADESLAIAQGFAAEENFEEEGFIEAPRRHKKKSAPKEVPPEPAPAAAPVVQEQQLPAADADEWEAVPAAGADEWEAPTQESPAQVEEVPPAPVMSTEAAAPPAPEVQPRVQETAPEPSGPPSIEKRIRNLKKKLVQIEKLKARGGEYTAEEQEKLDSQPKIQQEITALENGEPWPPVNAEPEPAQVEVQEETVPEPVQEEVVEEAEPAVPDYTPDEARKKIKALNKKLAQIGKLKEKSPKDLSPEEAGKVASESKIEKEIAVLETLL